MSLEDYQAKRKFDQTPEPTGGQGSGLLRFVVQKHHASHLHYDFRLEMGGILKSWAIPKGPSLDPEQKRLAMLTEDHPYDYRTFEGNIPKGNYGAGSVIVWDEGTYEPLGATGNREADDKLARQGVHQGHLTLILNGQKLNGEFALIKMKGGEENAWLLVKARKDEFVTEDDITEQDRSVVTGRTVDEVAEDKSVTNLQLDDLAEAPRATMPREFKPMLATLASEPFDSPEWLYEVKWDGYRIMSEVQSKKVVLHSRGGQDYTEKFAKVAQELHQLEVPALIDGEMVVVDEDGRSSFQALQNYLKTRQGQLVYYAFDLLHLDGHDLTGLPLVQRKDLLRRILPQADHLKYSDHVPEQGKALLASAKQQQLEGIMAKRADSTYQPGSRSHDWLKLKVHRRQEAVICGWTEPRGGRAYFGALILGVYEGKKLVYAGHCGGGFSDAQLRDIYDRLKPLEISESPIQPEPKTNEPAHWVKPEMVCEVQFTEWTADGSMRHPVFIGLREDKPAREVKREESTPSKKVVDETAGSAEPDSPSARSAGTGGDTESAPSPRSLLSEENSAKLKEEETVLEIGGKNVKLTHLKKIFWPDDHITKGDLLKYYASVAPVMLPYLQDRPESLNRFPNGITGASFYQKDMEHVPDWAKTITIHSDSEDRDLRYLLCQDEATLLYMINLGCIELNPWSSRTTNLEKPDWCVIDLDPEGIGFEAVIETAQAVHAVLNDLKIPGYPKTSGATGIHIYIPMGAAYTYDQVKIFAQLIAQLVHDRVPAITSLERSPKKRQGKIYLDFLQNRRGQTLASAYSVRPKPGATVSTPLHWDEVTSGLTPQQFTIFNIHDRLKLDAELWRPIIGEGIDLPAILHNLQS